MTISPVLEKKIAWGLQGERIIRRIPTTLLAFWRPQCPRTRPPCRPSGCQKCYGGSCWGSFHSLQKNRGCRGARIINWIHHNNFNTLKASMVTGFADMLREETTLLLMNRSPLQPLDYYFFESLRKNNQQDPPKHFGLPEDLHCGPIRVHAQGGEYARLVPLPL